MKIVYKKNKQTTILYNPKSITIEFTIDDHKYIYRRHSIHQAEIIRNGGVNGKIIKKVIIEY